MKTAGLKGFKIGKMFGVHLSHKQKLLDTGCLIGILIMVYLSPHIAGHLIPYIQLKQNMFLFTASLEMFPSCRVCSLTPDQGQ